ncbi:hypothetical protein GE061_011310 [Apolygus lucorum]|uniref:Uncharacterized protein n=1 Tax=Apolygus lucorum TaxID=248454 RepID=A0A6A4K7N5_APOLU|nr:hypothetical protein GE061_011310 [Apolygus lucorum]
MALWQMLFHGVETWTFKMSTLRRLEAFEMWIHRRMLRIPWTARTTDEAPTSDYHQVPEDIISWPRPSRRKIFSSYQLQQLIMKGKPEGRRGIEQGQMSWLRNIREGQESIDQGTFFCIAEDRDALSSVIARRR